MPEHEFVLLDEWPHTTLANSIKIALHEFKYLLSRNPFSAVEIQPLISAILYFARIIADNPYISIVDNLPQRAFGERD